MGRPHPRPEERGAIFPYSPQLHNTHIFLHHMLREVLENTLKPLREVRQQAEAFLHNSVTSNGSIDIPPPLI
jgi:hypothetical protein